MPLCVSVYSPLAQLTHHHFQGLKYFLFVYVCVSVCVCMYVTQLCSAFMSRADCALNESCASLVGRAERGGERGREEEERGQS